MKGIYVQLKSVVIIVLLLFSIVLTSCAKTSLSPIFSNPSEVGENVASSPGSGYVLSLVADDNVIIYNGEPITLPVKPIIRNDTFYFPLKEVTEVLGGTYSLQNETATIELFGVITQYQIGAQTVIINGEPFDISAQGRSFSQNDSDNHSAAENYTPIIVDNTVYVPADYAPSSVYNGFNAIRQYPESRMVILGEFKVESKIDEIELFSSYDNLPGETKSKFQNMGVIDNIVGYNIEKYAAEGIEVYVMRMQASQNDAENMNGNICTIHVTGGQYSTPRGLSVEDSAYLAWRLYGYEGLTNMFSYKILNGNIASITFYSRFYGSQF